MMWWGQVLQGFDTVTIIFYAVIAYIIGSIPSGLIIGKVCYGKDLRLYGSKNTGATNAYRLLGFKAAFSVFLCDAIKGAIGAWLFAPVSPLMVFGGLVAMLGHNCSVFLKFKGGRGVATGLGIVIYLAPYVSLICMVLWGLIVYFTRIVSLGSIIVAILTPILMFLFGESLWIVGFGVFGALFVVIRHKANIVRLLHGTELKVDRLPGVKK